MGWRRSYDAPSNPTLAVRSKLSTVPRQGSLNLSRADVVSLGTSFYGGLCCFILFLRDDYEFPFKCRGGVVE